jgi:hypothetical protein
LTSDLARAAEAGGAAGDADIGHGKSPVSKAGDSRIPLFGAFGYKNNNQFF